MQKGTLITEQELLGYNWKHLCNFVSYEVWGKGIDRIMWDRSTHEIYMVYQNKSNDESW
jgi:hypothetical protein